MKLRSYQENRRKSDRGTRQQTHDVPPVMAELEWQNEILQGKTSLSRFRNELMQSAEAGNSIARHSSLLSSLLRDVTHHTGLIPFFLGYIWLPAPIPLELLHLRSVSPASGRTTCSHDMSSPG